MKKLIALLLTACFILPCLSGCNITGKADKWNGKIASTFRSGSGTEAEPYRIASAEELAYLALSANAGNTYAGEYFSLECDIDLDNLEWTPIGTPDSPFCGSFNGNGHTISNLKMSDTVTYPLQNQNAHDSVVGNSIAGLFGYCEDASFCNLKLDGVEISVKNAYLLGNVFIGALAAKLEIRTNGKISDIQVCNASLIRHAQKVEDAPFGNYAHLFGGIVGFLYIKEETANCRMNRVQSDVYFDLKEHTFQYLTMAGGIVACLNNFGPFECRDFVTYTNAEFIDAREYNIRNICGAFGEISSGGSGIIKLSNAFSEIKVNQSYFYHTSENPNGFSAAAMIGLGLYKTSCTPEFNNLFGYVERTDGETAEDRQYLYVIKDTLDYTENNCRFTDTLPEDHGFDPEIWDLSDPSKPRLK